MCVNRRSLVFVAAVPLAPEAAIVFQLLAAELALVAAGPVNHRAVEVVNGGERVLRHRAVIEGQRSDLAGLAVGCVRCAGAARSQFEGHRFGRRDVGALGALFVESASSGG